MILDPNGFANEKVPDTQRFLKLLHYIHETIEVEKRVTGHMSAKFEKRRHAGHKVGDNCFLKGKE